MKGAGTGDRQSAAQCFRNGRGGGGARSGAELSEPGMLSVEMRQGSKWGGHRGQDSQDIEVLFSICPSVQKVE